MMQSMSPTYPAIRPDIKKYAHEDCTLLRDFLCVDRTTIAMIQRAQDAYDQHRTLLWIEGAQGVGKSLLIDRIIERDAQQQNTIGMYPWHRMTLSDEDSISTLARLDHLWATGARCVLRLDEQMSLEALHRYSAFLCASHDHAPALVLIESPNFAHHDHQLREAIYLLKHHILDHPHQHIILSPLHYRPYDTALYLTHYLDYCTEMMNLPHAPHISPAIVAWLQHHLWAHNIRSLQNFCFLLCQRRILNVHHRTQIVDMLKLSEHYDDGRTPHTHMIDPQWNISLIDEQTGAIHSLHDMEGSIIARLYQHHHGCKSTLSRDLAIGRTTLYRKLKEHGIS